MAEGSWREWTWKVRVEGLKPAESASEILEDSCVEELWKRELFAHFSSLQDAIKWSLNVDYVTTEGKGQIAHLWNLINVCLNWYKVISEGIQEGKSLPQRCMWESVFKLPNAGYSLRSTLSETELRGNHLPCQSVSWSEAFLSRKSVGSNGSWQKTSVNCWNDSSLHKPRAYATDLVQIWSSSSFLSLNSQMLGIMESTDSHKLPL